MLKKDYDSIQKKLVNWIKQQVKDSETQGVIVGLSGGIDSSVTAVLCKKAFPDYTIGIIMPCNSNPQDQKDAKEIASQFSINFEIINLEDTFQTLLDSIPVKNLDKIAKANIKPRLRMTVLYYYSNLYNYLVAGTGNRSELKLGYFTKYGDGGVDIEPLGNLVKLEVKKIAKILNIPKKIINKSPSAGLWEGQKDENELGISYQKIDKYILTGKGTKNTKNIVKNLIANNKHKLKPPLIPEL